MTLSQSHDHARRMQNRRLRADRMRAARARGTHTDAEWQALKSACDQQCVRCGTRERNLERDHITPVCKDGSDAIENIQPLCATCNCARGLEGHDHRPTGWRMRMEALL